MNDRQVIDQLYESVREYRSSENFRKMLDFCVRFKDLAPFNCAMVEKQLPGARYVLNPAEWKKRYNRRIKSTGRPVVILNFAPVDFVYDISDTEPISSEAGDSKTDQEILDLVAKFYDTKGTLSDYTYHTLISNLAAFGIDYGNYQTGATEEALLRRTDCEVNVVIRHHPWRALRYRGYFKILTKAGTGKEMDFASICHELGHYFCHHLTPPTDRWWSLRSLPHAVEEFEAETVAYLVCKRKGIDDESSIRYLAGYMANNRYVPDGISVDMILRAAGWVEKMLRPMACSDCFLYKYDAAFQAMVKGIRQGPREQTLEFK